MKAPACKESWIWFGTFAARDDAGPAAGKQRSAQAVNSKIGPPLEPPRGQASWPTAARISGKSFQVAANEACVESVSWDFRHDACTFILKDNKGQYPITCGLGKWVQGQTSMPRTPPKLTSGDLGPISKVAASDTWKDDNTFEMIWRFIETPHHDTVTCRFDGDNVKVEYLNSLTAMSAGHKDKRPPLEGRLQA